MATNSEASKASDYSLLPVKRQNITISTVKGINFKLVSKLKIETLIIFISPMAIKHNEAWRRARRPRQRIGHLRGDVPLSRVVATSDGKQNIRVIQLEEENPWL